MISYLDVRDLEKENEILDVISKVDLQTSLLYIIIDQITLETKQLRPIVTYSLLEDLVPPQQSYEAFGNYSKIPSETIDSMLVLEADHCNMRDAKFAKEILLKDYTQANFCSRSQCCETFMK